MSSSQMNDISEELRKVLQQTLKRFVGDAKERAKLAAILDKSEGHVQSMIYEGKGGLDVWTKALSHYYQLNLDHLKNLRSTIKKLDPVLPSDEMWFSIRDKHGASEEDCLYLARCALEAYLVKKEIEAERNTRK